MSVLFIAPLPEPVTGHSLACQIFFDELVRHRRVEVVDLNKKEIATGVSSVSRIFDVLSFVLAVFRKRKSCDLIYFTVSESYSGNLKDLLIYCACWPHLSRTIIHLHGGAGMRIIMQSGPRWLRSANEFFLKRLAGVIVLGPAHRDIFEGAVAKDRIYTVPNFAEEHVFARSEAIDAKFATTEPLKILFLSNFLPGKGHIELLDAVARLNDDDRLRVSISFAGRFQSADEERDFLRRIERMPNVRYCGVVAGEEKRKLLAEAHVLCLPTYYAYEGQPIAILEGYAAGCAVITTNHSGIGDIFADGVNGYVVEERSADSLHGAIEKALRRPADLLAFAKTNHAAALGKYRPGRYTADLLKIMDELQARSHER